MNKNVTLGTSVLNALVHLGTSLASVSALPKKTCQADIGLFGIKITFFEHYCTINLGETAAGQVRQRRDALHRGNRNKIICLTDGLNDD